MLATTNNTHALQSLAAIAPAMADRVRRGHAAAAEVLLRLQEDHISDAIAHIGPTPLRHERQRLQIGFDPTAVAVGTSIDAGESWQAMHPHAIGQIGALLGIPGRFLSEQLAGSTWQRASIAHLLTTHLDHTETRARVLVRTVGSQVRAVLTDSYRRLHSPKIAEAFATICARFQLFPYAAAIDDLRWAVSVLCPNPIEIESAAHGTEHVGLSLTLRNSDFGAGAQSLAVNVTRLVCANGMIAETLMRKVHTGTRLHDNIAYSEETYRADTIAVAHELADNVRHALTPGYIEQHLAPVRAAMAAPVDVDALLESLTRQKTITIGQQKTASRAIMERDGSTVPLGIPTRWTVAQAISAQAHGATIEDARKFETIAAQIVGGAK